MGNIKFTINIEHAEILLIMLVLFIAVVALIGVFAWWHKTDKQIETLSQIKNNLDGENGDGSNVNVTVINNGEPAKAANMEKAIEANEVIATESTENPSESRPPGETKPRNDKIIEDEPDEPILDIAALVAKESMEKLEREKQAKTAQHDGVAKSGRVYTEEELEKLINS